MPSSSSVRPSASLVPTAVLLTAKDGGPHRLAARLEKAGFEVHSCQSVEEARQLCPGAALCDPALLEGDDLSQRSMEQLVRARLETLLDRLGEEPVAGLYGLVMREVERGLLTLVLERCRGHKGKASIQLGLHRNTLRQKMVELDLDGGASKRRRTRR